MCGSMVNIQSPTAEIRRGKKEEEETGRKYICPHPAMQGAGAAIKTVKTVEVALFGHFFATLV